MNQELAIAVSLVSGYLLGSLPTAYLMGRLKEGIDIRTVGSRNMGAMNSFYRLGFGYGLIVLVIDMGKGAAAVWVARQFGLPDLVEMLAVIGVIGFLMPWVFAIGIPIFAVATLITKVPTISYGIAMLCFPFVAWLIYHNPGYIIFSSLLILVPFLKYIPRLFEMRRKAGSWRGVISRRSIKDRI